MSGKSIVQDKRLTLLFAFLLVLIFFFGAIFWFESFQRPPLPTPLPRPSPPIIRERFPISENFVEVVTQLNTSQKLIDYLNANFILEDREQKEPSLPEEFFERKRGTTWDFAIFTSYVLWKNRFNSAIIRYKYDDKINAVVVFRDTDLPKTIIFTKEGVSIYPHGWSFEEMFQKEEERLGTKITEYSLFYWTDRGELAGGEWKKR